MFAAFALIFSAVFTSAAPTYAHTSDPRPLHAASADSLASRGGAFDARRYSACRGIRIDVYSWGVRLLITSDDVRYNLQGRAEGLMRIAGAYATPQVWGVNRLSEVNLDLPLQPERELRITFKNSNDTIILCRSNWMG